ncbi:hypothetical protein CRUP_019196 [Coryphaenoides rupestris]|nr:hypothetical protein CRUP_019196 [Coryphaenoides rupestris]
MAAIHHDAIIARSCLSEPFLIRHHSSSSIPSQSVFIVTERANHARDHLRTQHRDLTKYDGDPQKENSRALLVQIISDNQKQQVLLDQQAQLLAVLELVVIEEQHQGIHQILPVGGAVGGEGGEKSVQENLQGAWEGAAKPQDAALASDPKQAAGGAGAPQAAEDPELQAGLQNQIQAGQSRIWELFQALIDGGGLDELQNQIQAWERSDEPQPPAKTSVPAPTAHKVANEEAEMEAPLMPETRAKEGVPPVATSGKKKKSAKKQKAESAARADPQVQERERLLITRQEEASIAKDKVKQELHVEKQKVGRVEAMMQEQHAAMQKEMGGMQARQIKMREQLEGQISRLQQENSILRDAVSSAANQMESKHSAELNKYSGLMKELAETKGKLQQVEQEAPLAKERLVENQRKQQGRRRELLALHRLKEQSTLDSDWAKGLTVALHRRDEEMADLREKLADSKRQIQQVHKEKLADADKSRKQLQSELSGRDHTIQQLTKDQSQQNNQLYQKACQDLEAQQQVMEDMRLALSEQEEMQQEQLIQNYLHKVNADWEKLQSAKQELQNQLLALQTQLEQLQEETFRLEAAKDDYRIRCEEQVQELVEVRSQNEELTSLADEAQSLKDEMEVLRHSSDKVSKLEGTVEYYKKKLEDFGVVRRRSQVKLLEDKNTMYMQSTVSLEEDLRKANAAKGQLETYKRQVVELQNRLSDESKKVDKMEFEYKRLKEKVESLQKEKDHMRTERDSLKETIDELETENRLINQRVIKGQGQVEELKKDLQEQGLKADNSAILKKKNQEYMDKLLELNDELLKKSAYIDDMEPKYNANTHRVDELEEALKRKEDHESMQDMNRLLKQREELTQHKEKVIRKWERLAREELEREDEGTPQRRERRPTKQGRRGEVIGWLEAIVIHAGYGARSHGHQHREPGATVTNTASPERRPPTPGARSHGHQHREPGDTVTNTASPETRHINLLKPNPARARVLLQWLLFTLHVYTILLKRIPAMATRVLLQ